MNLAWSVGFSPTYDYLSKSAQTHLQICWFVAVTIGAFLAAISIQKLTKRVLNGIASTLVIINGILYLSAPDSVTAIVAARYCDGIAFGLTVLSTIVAGSEQSVKRFRGFVLSIKQTSIITGTMIQIMNTKNWKDNWQHNTNQMLGLLALLYGVIALVFIFTTTIESPIFYLRKNNEAEAINTLRRLQKPLIVTDETHALLHESKQLLEEDKARGCAENISSGLRPLLKLCLFRSIVSMSFSLPLTWALLMPSALTIRGNNLWIPSLYISMRLIGATTAAFTLDTMGRKGMSAFALLVGGGFMISVGSLSSNYWSILEWKWMDTEKMEVVMGLLMAYQVFAGLAAPASTCYLGEAFSVTVKPYFIMAAVIVENVVQIIICCTFKGSVASMSHYGYALGSIQLAFAIIFLFVMPETKKTTLREALAKFKKTENMATS